MEDKETQLAKFPTTSEAVASLAGAAHDQILKKIDNLKKIGVSFSGQSTRESRGRKFKTYNLTYLQASKIFISIKNKKGVIFGNEFLDRLSAGLSIEAAYIEASLEASTAGDKAKRLATYIVRNRDLDEYKIGRTSGDFASRVKLLQTGNSCYLELCVVLAGDFELELHDQYESKNINGEWFALTEEDIYIDIKNKYRKYFHVCDTFDAELFDLCMDSGGKEELRETDILGRKLTFGELDKATKLMSETSFRHIPYNERMEALRSGLLNSNTTTNTTGK